jgi:hypothetical protein
MVKSPPAFHTFSALGYQPFSGYESTNQIADLVYNSFTLGMEDHLLKILVVTILKKLLLSHYLEIQIWLRTICIVQFFVKVMFPWPSLAHYFYCLILCKVRFHDCHSPTICTVPFFVRSYMYIHILSVYNGLIGKNCGKHGPTPTTYVNSSYNRVFLKVILSSPCLWACFHLLWSIPSFSEVRKVMKFY